MKSGEAKEIALARFAEKFNCAEATLLGLTTAMGINEPCIPRIATGLGAGVGSCGDTCGAISGAAMAIGLKFGRETADDLESKNLCYAKVQELVEAFEKEFGSSLCLNLTNCEMRTPEGRAHAKELDLHNKVCPAFVAFAADLTQRLIGD
jgi:C_GCAxxG_C_C family probable redox protein